MKTKSTSFLLALGLLAGGSAVYAQPQQPQQQENAPQNGGSGPAPYERTNLRQRLALSAAQVSQLRTINRERKAQLDAVERDGSLAPAARRQKTKEIRMDAENKIRGMLSQDQLAEYDQIKRERREQAVRNRQTAQPPQ